MVDGVKVKTTMPQSLPDILYSVDQWKTTRGTTPIYDIFQQNLPEASSILTEEQKAAERPRLFQEKDKLTADFAAAGGVASPELKARAAKLKREFQMFGVPFQ
jgi:hypothetical protein